MRRILFIIIVMLMIFLSACTGGVKPRNGLFLYFPTTADSTFPEYNDDLVTSPLAAFDVSDLDSGIGTTTQLISSIFDIVKTDYYEFDVGVSMSTTKPSPSGTRWQIVGVGSDTEDYVSGGSTYTVFGVAQAVDTQDSDGQDYARIYADSFGEAYGGSGGALNGTNSTLARWATAIGHTVSHEAGHNYGLAHGNSSPVSGEDQVTNHIMATGATLTGEIRASINRHFSDTSYEILGHNIGLSIRTLYNWDFVNPNSSDAHSLVITLLSEAPSLTISWSYNGDRSPWSNPTVSSASGTQNFQGTTYNVFKLTFKTAKSWCCGSNGIVNPGKDFHVGASFNETKPVIVYEATLKDSNDSDLPLHPRTVGFNSGAADMASGDFELTFFNTDPEARPLIIEDMRVVFLPRLMYIDSMLANAKMLDYRGIEVLPYQTENLKIINEQLPNKLDKQFSITLSNLADPRHVDITYDATGCVKGFKPPTDVDKGEIEYCPDGTVLSLFPATAVYIMALVVDPNAEYFDPESGELVNGPLESWVFYQFAGFVPDYNNNGVDDLLDIRYGKSSDDNRNGVPDEAEK